MTSTNILITGSVRSGKSQLAVALAAASEKTVVFVATCQPQDEEMHRRVDRHRADRPEVWQTLEEPLDLVGVLGRARADQLLIIDCLTLWVSNHLLAGLDEEALLAEADRLAAALVQSHADVILVSNEVGWGIVPENAMARVFRDVVGRLHQKLAKVCDRVYLVTAGLPLKLKG